MKKKIIFVLLSFVVLFAFSSCVTDPDTHPLRLHVIANSNGKEDQRIKLCVRDAVLEYTKEAALDFKNAEDVKRFVYENKDGLVDAARDVLDENGAGYSVSLSIGRYYFPEKTYGDTVYEAGYYDAVRIVLGSGEGKNWWCVIFPPLCLINTCESEPVDTKNVRFTSLFASLCE